MIRRRLAVVPRDFIAVGAQWLCDYGEQHWRAMHAAAADSLELRSMIEELLDEYLLHGEYTPAGCPGHPLHSRWSQLPLALEPRGRPPKPPGLHHLAALV